MARARRRNDSRLSPYCGSCVCAGGAAGASEASLGRGKRIGRGEGRQRPVGGLQSGRCEAS